MAGKTIPVSFIDRTSPAFKPQVFSALQRKIENCQGEVVALVHPRYSERNPLFRTGGLYEQEYGNFMKELIPFLSSCSKPILCFLQEDRADGLRKWLESLQLKSPLVSIVTADDTFNSPKLAPSKNLPMLGSWYSLKNLLEEIGVKRISLVGERQFEEDGKVRGCVPFIAWHLGQRFHVKIIDKHTFQFPLM
jgi:hypothetical protein